MGEPAKDAKKRSWKRTAMEIGIVVAIFFAFRAWQTRDAPHGPAPALSGPSVEGTPLALAARPGKPVLVHFWATWCGVCRAEQDTIDALAEDHEVITVAAQSGSPGQVAAFVQQENLRFPVIVDASGELARRWGVHAFPTSFVLAPDGTIRSTEVGYTTSLGLRARLWLASVM
jgi:thiol-disulfide isomerase/thioredoxin